VGGAPYEIGGAPKLGSEPPIGGCPGIEVETCALIDMFGRVRSDAEGGAKVDWLLLDGAYVPAGGWAYCGRPDRR
jgi:hypothetical protein